MCGRFALPDEATVSKFLKIDRWNWHWPEPRYNVAPTTRVPIVVKAEDDLLELNGARWGLIPHWWKKDTPPSLTFNARSEEASEKPTWRKSMRGMRCLMPVRGWYEWNENELVRSDSGRKVKQPYFINPPYSDIIAFAGHWAIWSGQDGSQVLSCALLSIDARPGIPCVFEPLADGVSEKNPKPPTHDEYADLFDEELEAATAPKQKKPLVKRTEQDRAQDAASKEPREK